ncbi:amino acid ABC transporter permease [Paraburkholderia sediminicola]|uniref:Amino acid ABC transporter permease n=1 Tax=Paraburkholderia metrosideri TaxID=580937 RepID=A0ABW9DWU5_9BURK
MKFDPSIIFDNAPLFLHGALLTLEICVCALLIGYLMGILLALMRIAPQRLLRLLSGGWITLIRGVPFIILLFVVHYGLPFAGVRLPSIVTGTVSLATFASVYYAEVIRAAVQALPTGQYQSARAIGMSPFQATRHVIVPQILRALVPPSTNVTLTMMKESAVLSSVTVPELSYQGLIVQGNTFAPFEVFAAVAGLYWLIAIATAEAARWLERHTGGAQDARISRNALAERYLSLEKRGVQ